jgi:very-short-patch-repair endonuclease
VDGEVARIAGRQHRVINTRQLRAVGLTEEAVAYRVEQERMRRLWRGIYLVGPGQPDPLSLAMGGVLSAEPAGILSHGWAGWTWDFVSKTSFPVDVTIAGSSRRGPPPVRIHRSRSLDPRDITRRKGIPVTTPARTLLDLAETTDVDALGKLAAEAQVIGAVTERQLHDVIARHPTRRGAARLRAALDDGPMLTKEESERLLFNLLKAAGLPRPQTNARVGRYKPDFLYRDERLIIEVDGFSTHGHRRAFETDRVRQQELVARRYRVMRVTYRQLTNEPIAIAARIAAALA